MPKVSVIIPVFNAEKYIRKSLESVINQTLKDIEIICINDGSTDNSLLILEEYANKDNRIRIINKENGGYGSAMNTGLNEAEGEYTGIIEPDDYTELNMYEELYNIACLNNSDMVKSDFYCYTAKNNVSRKNGQIPFYLTFKKTDITKNPRLINLVPSIWSAIYKNEFIKDNGINFLETKGASYQDTSFAFKTTSLAKNIILTNKAYIHYRKDNMNSSVNKKDKIFAICDEYDEITNFLNNHSEIKAVLNDLKLIKQYRAYVWNVIRIDSENRYKFVERFSKTFLEFYKNNEIKDVFFKKINKKEFKTLLEDKEKYKILTDIKAEAKLKQQKRQKMFSIHINFNRISIVLFGKQILEIG